MRLLDGVGWVATAVFVGSYFFRRPGTLRRVQMVGALLWIVYGLLMKAAPVIVANVLVLAAAVWTARRGASDAASSEASPSPAALVDRGA
jgi:hypothetical protein